MSRVLIAGGATGIGQAAALAFAAAGHRVVVADRNAAEAERTASQAPGAVSVFPADLIEPGAAEAAVAHAVATLGGLDTVLVTAALLVSAPLSQWTEEMWDRSLALNLKAPFLLARAAAPHLARSDNASLIFTSSTGALRGHAGMPAYHASKAGLIGLMRSLADELGPQGVRVNCILPGWIDTPFNDPFWSHQADAEGVRRGLESAIPARRLGEPRDVSGVILFLASAAAKYMTGAALVVDGGYTAV